MKSAERVYVDPSALRASYVHEARSRAFCAWRRALRGPIVLTRHGRAELVNSIALGVFRRLLDAAVADAALANLDADVESGDLIVVDLLWRRALDLAAELSRIHTPRVGTRTLDVLHVAAAITLEKKTFVTYDDRQRALARATGLRTHTP